MDALCASWPVARLDSEVSDATAASSSLIGSW